MILPPLARCYVNRLRDVFGNQGTLTIDGTGFLPFMPTDTPCDPAVQACANTTFRGEPEMLTRWGYDGPGWESWGPIEMERFLEHQGAHSRGW